MRRTSATAPTAGSSASRPPGVLGAGDHRGGGHAGQGGDLRGGGARWRAERDGEVITRADPDQAAERVLVAAPGRSAVVAGGQGADVGGVDRQGGHRDDGGGRGLAGADDDRG